jgi:hypothetical protein
MHITDLIYVHINNLNLQIKINGTIPAVSCSASVKQLIITTQTGVKLLMHSHMINF